jgi:hypothetical protein
MPLGLPVSRLINVSLSLSSAIAGFANLTSTTLLGETDEIDTTERIRAYSSLSAIGSAFGSTSPEYLAAQAYFSQSPPPAQVYLGRWAHSATAGRLIGIPLTAQQQQMSNFNQITAGAFHIQFNGSPPGYDVRGINLTGTTNLNGVAAAIQAAARGTTGVGIVTITWDGVRFIIRGPNAGAGFSVQPLTDAAAPAHTYLGPLIGCDSAQNPASHNGSAAETLLQAVQALDAQATYYYALNTDACPDAADADREAVAAYIEASGAASLPHIYCFTCQDPNALTSATTDVGAVLQAGGYQRTFVQWSSTSQYAACSEIALFMTVNLEGSDTMITAAYKDEPGITPESLSTNSANYLDQKGYNYYAMFNNGVPVLVNGCMICTSILPGGGANEVYIDEMLGADGLANAIQTDYFNLMTQLTKLPQTDAGSHLGATAIESACDQFVTNGYLGPGVWNASGFGQIATGSFLSKGYYIYTPPIATQAQADRSARKSVPYQVAAKTAGAIHTANIAVTVNP